MNPSLERAVSEVSKLPEEEQEVIARWLLALLEEDARWDFSFSRSQKALGTLAEQALTDFRAGRTTPLDLDTLEGD